MGTENSNITYLSVLFVQKQNINIIKLLSSQFEIVNFLN